jgi:hypothetical protein
MLGEQIGEEKGKVRGQRILDINEWNTKDRNNFFF